MEPWNPRFPVGELKVNVLSIYEDVVGFSDLNYDVEFTRDIVLKVDSPSDTIAKNMRYMNPAKTHYLKEIYLEKGLPVLLTVGYPGHAVAYIIDGSKVYVFDTQKTETTESWPVFTHAAISAMFDMEFEFVDALDKYPTLNIQTDNDDYCVIWMLFILELAAFGKQKIGKIDISTIIGVIQTKAQQEGGTLELIRKVYREYMAGQSFMVGGSTICPCSPDTGDCPKCKKSTHLHKMAGKRKTTKKWIQDVVSHMKEGAFTKQARSHGETPMEYAQDVLKHPKKHTLKTRRRAQFLKNIAKGRKKTSRSRK